MNASPLSRPASAATPATTSPSAASPTAAERRFGRRYLAKVIGLYVLFSVLWIFVSDELLALFIQNPTLTLWLGMAKGWLFILITTGALYLLIGRFVRALIDRDRALQALNADLERRVAERTAAPWRPRWPRWPSAGGWRGNCGSARRATGSWRNIPSM